MTAALTTPPTTVLPRRHQRSRRRGAKLPQGVRIVDRTTIFGNPFKLNTYHALARVPAVDGSPWEYEGRISGDGTRHDCHWPDGRITIHHVRYMTREECVETYARALITPTPQLRLYQRKLGRHLTVDDVREQLAGRDLACSCPPDLVCHADVLLWVANCTEQELADTAAVLAATWQARRGEVTVEQC